MFQRNALAQVRERLGRNPAVAILGPRQVGKTTLALQVCEEYADAIDPDPDRPGDPARLAEPEALFAANCARLIVPDEVQNLPGIFSVLRGGADTQPIVLGRIGGGLSHGRGCRS